MGFIGDECRRQNTELLAPASESVPQDLQADLQVLPGKKKKRRITKHRDGGSPRHVWNVSLRVTDAEEREILAWAMAQNESMSELVRRAVMTLMKPSP